MPWCPKCNTEYREGFTTCVDCNVSLVDDIASKEEYIDIVSIRKKELAERFVEFLAYSKIDAAMRYLESEDVFSVYVKPEDVKNARKCYEAFYKVEHERELEEKKNSPEALFGQSITSSLEDEPATDEDAPVFAEKLTPSSIEQGAYVKKAAKYQDLKSTGYTFVIFGALGIVFLVLNYTGVISWFHGIFSYIVAGGMFFAFFYIGISSLFSSKKAAKEAVVEEELTGKINTWLSENITEDYLNHHQDIELSPEANFIRMMDYIKEDVLSAFGDMDDSYVDSVIEEFYNSRFE